MTDAATPTAARVSWFGPSALLTPANLVTVGRLLVSPVLLYFIVDDLGSWPAVSLWIALAVTDGVDGWLARRHGTTRSGAFLDPLADKVLVLGAMIALVAAGRWPLWPVLLIAARELGIQAFRSFWVRRGLAVPASMLAKVKTVVQEVAVGLCLLPLTEDHHWFGDATLSAAVVLTVVSGVQYVVAGSRATRTGGSLASP
jgi:CDP-diacylglycerol--glycerol-3-phosphate 3-phosphatidyltransferase